MLPTVENSNLLNYFGSKFKCAHQIAQYMPSMASKSRDYVFFDVFCGSCAMSFAANPKNLILNDKYDLIYNFWKVIRDKSKELEEEMKYIWNGAKVFAEYRDRTDDIGKAVFALLKFCSTLQSRNNGFAYFYSQNKFKKNFESWANWFNNRRVQIWDKDFRDLFKQINKIRSSQQERAGFVIYCDPPYFVQGSAYTHTFCERDHLDLHDCLMKIKDHDNKWIYLSYDDCPFIRELYADWYVKEIAFAANMGQSAKNYHELLISNKPIIKRRSNSADLKKWI